MGAHGLLHSIADKGDPPSFYAIGASRFGVKTRRSDLGLVEQSPSLRQFHRAPIGVFHDRQKSPGRLLRRRDDFDADPFECLDDLGHILDGEAQADE